METPLRWTHIFVPISEPRLGDTFPLLVLKPQIRGSLTDEHQACTTTRKQHRNPNNLNFALHCQCLWGINIGLVNLSFYGHARVIFLPQGTALSCLWLPEATGPPHQLNSSSYTVSSFTPHPSKAKPFYKYFRHLNTWWSSAYVIRVSSCLRESYEHLQAGPWKQRERSSPTRQGQ